MKRYKFNLAAVLRVRNVELALANQNIARISQKIIEIEKKVIALQSQYETSLSNMVDGGILSPLLYREQATRIYQDIFALRQESKELGELLNREKMIGIEKKRRVEILENIDSQRKIAWMQAYDKEESLLLDEIGSNQAILRSYSKQKISSAPFSLSKEAP